MHRLARTRPAALALGLTCLMASAAVCNRVVAETVEEFYRGKQVKLLLSAAPGGGADLYAPIVINHLGRHIPGNPTFVIINQPGAGGLVAAAQLQNAAPRDGSMIGFLQRNNLLEPVLSTKDVGFDPRRVAWVGSITRDKYVIASWHTSGVRTLKDVMQRELVLGNTGGANENITLPLLLNDLLGTKFKLTRGYKGSEEVAFAIERGEVQGRAMGWTTFKAEHAPWIEANKVAVLVQIAMEKHPDSAIKDVPLALDLLKNDEDRRFYELMLTPLDAGRPFAVPIDTPADRIAAFRTAIESLTKDHAFLEEVKSRGGSVELARGEDMQALVNKLYETPRPMLERARTLLQAR